MKNVLFCFIVFVWSPTLCDSFLKYQNSFLYILVYVGSLASYDTCFQIIQKHKKKYKISKYKNINVFKQDIFLRTT